MQIDFETLLLKTGFKVTKLQRGDKLHIAIDFEEIRVILKHCYNIQAKIGLKVSDMN